MVNLSHVSQVEYAHESQISFLRLIYTSASQKMTYFCSNVVAYKDSRTSDTRNAISLLGANDFEFGQRALRKKYVLLDGCAVCISICICKLVIPGTTAAGFTVSILGPSNQRLHHIPNQHKQSSSTAYCRPSNIRFW